MALTPLTRVQQATVPPADRAAREFDRLRRARNQDRYEAKPVGAAVTEKAEQVARTLFDAARGRGISL